MGSTPQLLSEGLVINSDINFSESGSKLCSTAPSKEAKKGGFEGQESKSARLHTTLTLKN